MRYVDKLSKRIQEVQSHLCVGLDPRPELIEGDLEAFLSECIEATAPYAAAFKPNIAYFEAYGSQGIVVLERILRRIPERIPILLDAKRSDIPATMEAYARAYFEQWGVDAVTLNGLMGLDSIEPFLQSEEHGIYLLGVTSNPGAADVELQQVDGRYVFELMQEFAVRAGSLPGQVGMVMGLTNVSDEVLGRVADLPLLVPGLGAQGGDLSRLQLTGRSAPWLINASRSILYGEEGSPESRAKAARDKISNAVEPPS
jgi:orotidine 5'-phosphate decarboxylase subfamily 2